MSILHTYKLVQPGDGAEFPFAELRVTSAVLERHLDSPGDRLELVMARGAESGPALPLGERLDLVDAAGRTRFSGWLLAPELRATAGRQEHRYVLEGPQWYLQRLTYLQPGWNFATDFESPDGDLEAVRHGRVIFNQRPDFLPATVPEQLADLLVWAQSQGAPLTFSIIGLPEIRPPEEEHTDITVWESLDRLLAWLPHWHWRWDYSGGMWPRLRFLAAGTPRTLAAGACAELRAAHRRDLLTGRLAVQFVQIHSELVDDGADGQVRRDWLERVTQTSEAGDYPGQLRTTSYLRGALHSLVFNEETGQFEDVAAVAAEQAPEENLAEILHTAFAQPAIEWEAVIEDADVDWSWRPGDRLAMVGVHADWEAGTAPALVETVRHTLELGRTELRAGSRARLGLRQVIANMGARSVPQSFSERQGGETSKSKIGAGSEQTSPQRIRIYGCTGGEAVYYLFRPSAVAGPYPV